MKGRKIYAAIKNRKKANVNVPIFSSDHLKIGEAVPHIVLATINAITAFW